MIVASRKDEMGTQMLNQLNADAQRIAELEAALTDALDAADMIDGFVCGCGFVESKDYGSYEEAQARIERARLALPKAQEAANG